MHALKETPRDLPAEIIAEARRWVGTPYRHQGRQRTIAVDCVGLIFGVCQEVGIGDQAFWDYVNTNWKAYKRVPDGNTLADAFDRYAPAYPRHRAEPGDVLMIAYAGAPRHTAFLTESNTIIHAYTEARKTCENQWTGEWLDGTVSAYRVAEAFV